MSDEITEAERYENAVAAARLLKNLHKEGHLNKDIREIYHMLTEDQRKELVLGFLEGRTIQKISDDEAQTLHPSLMAELEEIRKEDRLSLIKLRAYFTKVVLIVLGSMVVLTMSSYLFLGKAVEKTTAGTDWLLRIVAEILGIKL